MAEVKIDSPLSKKEGGVLAGLWRKIIHDIGYDRHLDYLVSRYIAKTDKMSGRVQNVRRKTKSSLIKNISSSEMTFKTFLDLLFNYIGVRKVDISIKLSFYNGEERITSMSVINDNTEEEEQPDGTSTTSGTDETTDKTSVNRNDKRKRSKSNRTK